MSAILVVDDSLTVRMDLADSLEAAGFHAVPCGSLAEARTALRTHAIALAILDVRLPDGDGIAFLDELRGDPRFSTLPILMLSSEADVSDRIRGLKTGATDYVGKPYDTGFVLARVGQLVAVERAPAGRLVIAIDDSPTFRNVLGAALTSAGYETLLASSGAEGLRLAATRPPAVIIVDGVMPQMDGPTLIRRVRFDPVLRTTPCVLLTGSDDATAEVDALDVGADAFVRKESDMAVILARVAAVLRATHEHTPPAALSPKRILAVDDSPTYLHTLGDQLRDEGYDVVLATSGAEAIDLLAVQDVDCILLDRIMPGLTGAETCMRLKAVPVVRDIPLIMLTAHDNRDAMIDGFAAGADDFISKSSGLDVLKARVKAQIRRKQFEDEHRRVREQLLRTEHEASEARVARELAETRAALAEQLERSNARLAAANTELEAFSYSVSHDLRAPLRTIAGFTNILDETLGDRHDDTTRDCTRRVLAASARMSDLIDALLELARIGRAPIAAERVDLSAVAAQILDEHRQRDPARAVDSSVAPDLQVRADPRLVRIVLDNLLGNAWKFTARRTPARIEVGRRDGAFFVRDNGAGFDMAYAARLFTPFQRLHSDAAFPGSGVGLATVKRVVDRHGGRIWAESAVDQGTTFLFTLPA